MMKNLKNWLAIILVALILIFAQRYVPEFGLGSLIATMLPYSIAILVSSLLMLALWFALGLPLGPDGASFHYEIPAAAETAQLVSSPNHS